MGNRGNGIEVSSRGEPPMSQEPNHSSSSARGEQRLTWALAQVRRALEGLRYGTITLTVQDGVVVQLERSEKLRFSRLPESERSA